MHTPLVCAAQPVTETTLNYAPVAVGIVLVWALGSFFCPGIGARHWYRGEKHNIEDFTVRQTWHYMACTASPVRHTLLEAPLLQSWFGSHRSALVSLCIC